MDNLIKLWTDNNQEIVRFDYSDIKEKLGNEKYSKYLSETGLPCQAQPYLNFDNSIYKDNHLMPAENFPDADNYFAIGFTGEGNIICIEKDSGKIVWVDADTEEGCIHLINSSLEQLYKSMHEYMEFALKSFQKYGSVNEYTKEDFDTLKNNLAAIDKTASEHSGETWEFWAERIEFLGEKFIE